MSKLSKKEIEQRLVRLTNLERLYPIARQRIELLAKEKKELKEMVKTQGKLLRIQTALIERFTLRIEELEKMVFGKKRRKNKDNDCSDEKDKDFKERKPRDPSTYRRPLPRNEDITETNDYPLGNCPDCNTPLENLKWIVRYEEDMKIFEKLLKKVAKQKIQSGYCPCCRKRSSALPISSQVVSLGDNVRMFVCYCIVILNLSFEKTKHLIKDISDIQISDGEISKILKKQARTLTPNYHKLTAVIRAGPTANYDETGWRVQKEEQGNYGWVMAGANTTDTVFRLGQSRGKGNAEKLKGRAENQVAVSDDYVAYKNLFKHHQLCWAHPIRKLRDLVNSKGLATLAEDKRLEAQKAYQSLRELHQSLKDIKDQPFSIQEKNEIKEKMIQQLVEIAKPCANDPTKLANIKKGLIKNQDKYFTCLMFPDVPTTNNRAERALRHLVLKRKSSFGSKTQQGAWSMSVLCSVLLSLWWSKPDDFFGEYAKLLN